METVETMLKVGWCVWLGMVLMWMIGGVLEAWRLIKIEREKAKRVKV